MTLIAKLTADEKITDPDVDAMRADARSISAAERQDIRAAIEAYEVRNAANLQGDVDTRSSLLQLKQELLDADMGRSTIESTIRDAAGTATQAAEKTADRAKALGYKQWVELTHPDRSTSSKVLGWLGVLAVGYGVYRAAKWVKGTSESSWGGRLLRFLGIGALAGLAINYFGAEEEKTAPAAAPKANPELMVDGKRVRLEKNAAGETTLMIDNQSYRIKIHGMPVGQFITETARDKDEFRLTCAVPIKGKMSGYVATSTLERLVRMLVASPDQTTEVTMDYHTTPKTDPNRASQEATLQFERI